jgi:hypothetical protein
MAFKKHFWPEEAIGGFALSGSGLGGGYKKAALRLTSTFYRTGMKPVRVAVERILS